MRAAKLMLVSTVLALASDATAAPIRVGIYKAVGFSSRYWHTHIHPGSAIIASMLANPVGAGLQNPVIPPQGFSVTMFGVDTSCATNGCTASTEQKETFIAALDTLDVVLFMSNTSFGSGFSPGVHRDRLASFWLTKGVVSMHGSIDGFGEWAAWDSANAARFQNHPSGDRNATVRLDTIAAKHHEPAWRFLNKGMPDTARFFEEWFSFTVSSSVIRSREPLVVTVNVNENSYEGGMGGAKVMGDDHPLSWYREFPEGGRFFYTALGHRLQTFDSVYFFRRQLYNAILWAGGYDVATAIQARGTEVSGGKFGDHSRIRLSGGTLTVSLLHNGAHTVEILSLDGRRIDSRRGAARGNHTFTNLRPGVHLIAVTTPEGRSTRLVAIE